MKKTLSFIAVFMLLEALVPQAWAHDGSVITVSGQGIYYNYDSSNQTITITHPGASWDGYSKPIGALVIPDSITHNGITYPVTRIWSEAFYNCTFLTSVIIPNTVTTMGGWAFKNCTGLTSVEFNADSCTYAGGYDYTAFSGCSNIANFTFGSNVKVVPAYLCQGMTGLTSITIPESITYIGDGAFNGCGDLTSVVFNADSCIHAGTINYPAFNGCSNIANFIFGSNVKVVPAYLCQGMTGLSSITIPDSITYIGNVAFGGCSGLTSVVFNADSCIYAGSNDGTFSGCTGITSFTFGSNVKVVPAYLCFDLSSLTSVSIPNAATLIGRSAFGLTSLTSITIPKKVTYIGSNAFVGCSGLTSVVFNADSCIYAGDSFNAFRNCPNVSNFTFGNNVKSIPAYLCRGMSGLTSVSIPDSVTSIGDYAFSNCTGLTETIVLSAEQIGVRAFYNCDNIPAIVIGENVTLIDSYAFAECDSLRSITCHSELPATIGSDAFRNTPSDKVFYIPCGTTSAYNSAWGYFNYSEPVVDFEVTVLSSNTDRGTATMVTPRISCVDSSIVVRANANYHYHFVSWSNGRTANPDTLFLNSDTSVTALFAPDRYQVNVVSNDTVHGSVTGSGEYDYLDTILLTASAAEHYHFVRWNGWYTENPYQYVVTGNTTITGYFEIDRHQVVAISNDEMKGVVTGGGSYNYGSPCTLTASAYTGYQFIGWSNGQTANPYSFPVLEDMELTAMFVEEGVTSYTVTATSADLAMGTATVNGGSTATVEAGETVTLVATANEGYHFTRWNDNSTDATRTVTVTGDILYIAYFESDAVETYTVSVSSDDPSMGTATVNGSSTATVELGEIVTLVATANEGYQFVRWNDDNTDATRTVIVTSDMSFTAYFESLEGIEDVDGNGIRVYAVNGQIVVDGIGEERILIYDIVGRNVRNESLPRGVYMVKVGDNPARKVVVIK